MKKYIPLLLALFFAGNVSAQQSSMFGQAAGEFGLRNPAGLSIDEMRFQGNILNVYIRNQWWNSAMPGNPKTQSLTWLNNAGERNWVGAALFADKVGETRRFGLQGRYARILSDGLQIGLGAGLNSQEIRISNLDVYDEDDELLSTLGVTQWHLKTQVGLFYFLYDINKSWNWFAGISYGQNLALQPFLGQEEKITQQAVYLQGGIGWRDIWTGARLRFSFDDISAGELYLRKYFYSQLFFVGFTSSSDLTNHTAGIQFGYEKALGNDGQHQLNFSFGLSKPLSTYIVGGDLIFDGRITWVLGQEKKLLKLPFSLQN